MKDELYLLSKQYNIAFLEKLLEPKPEIDKEVNEKLHDLKEKDKKQETHLTAHEIHKAQAQKHLDAHEEHKQHADKHLEKHEEHLDHADHHMDAHEVHLDHAQQHLDAHHDSHGDDEDAEPTNNFQLDNAILWVQNSAEYAALCHQAYNIAAMNLQMKLAKRSDDAEKKAAIVLDLDETVLDNSPFQAKLFLNNEEYSQAAWDAWVEMAHADAIPGVKRFLDDIDTKQVEIFYISNRREKHLDATYENLKRLRIPVKKENIFLKTETSSKDARRKIVREEHEILLLVGDNLIDFTSIFDAEPSSRFRHRLMGTIQEKFGDKFIVLPNPNYGQWQSALYNYNYSLSPIKKFKLAKQTLLSF